MSTATMALGPVSVTFQWGRGRHALNARSDRPVDIPAAAGATDADLARLSRGVDIDELRRSIQSQAALIAPR